MTDEQSQMTILSFLEKMVSGNLDEINIEECDEMIETCNIIKNKIKLDIKRGF